MGAHPVLAFQNGVVKRNFRCGVTIAESQHAAGSGAALAAAYRHAGLVTALPIRHAGRCQGVMPHGDGFVQFNVHVLISGLFRRSCSGAALNARAKKLHLLASRGCNAGAG